MKKVYPKSLTLTELLLAAAILTFVLCGLLALFVNCLFLNEGNRNLTTAVAHAQYIMEEIRNEDSLQDIKDKIDGGNFTEFQDLPNENMSVCCFNPPDTSCLAFCQDGGDPLGIYVRIDWKDRGRRDRYTELQTLITNYQ